MYCKLLYTVPPATFPSLTSHHTFRTSSHSIFKHRFNPNHSIPRPHLSLKTHHALSLQIRCTANRSNGTARWEKLLPRNIISAEKVLRLIASATSSPICQFISSPPTFLHSLDPRIKLVWLLALVIIPARSLILVRFGVAACLTLLSMWIQPTQVWMDQLGRVSLLSGILFIMIGLGTDLAPPLVKSRTPTPSIMGLPKFPASLEGYSYLIFKLGPLQLTRKGLSAASRAACLTFTIFQSASLCLTTTAPEQLAFALQWFMFPLACFGVPVAEVTLLLLLSLRFISLAFDEVRNVALGIVSRRISWQQLTTLETLDIFITYIRRIFKNLFKHAEQISQAMIVRGFRGDSKTHKIYFPSNSSSGMANIASVFCLVCLVGTAVLSEYVLV